MGAVARTTSSKKGRRKGKGKERPEGQGLARIATWHGRLVLAARPHIVGEVLDTVQPAYGVKAASDWGMDASYFNVVTTPPG
eukprot:355369-Chlamydomonas_euryale.AAC.4